MATVPDSVAGKIVVDGKLAAGDCFNDLKLRGKAVYEVIRTRNGVPYFFSDHCSRLSGSLLNIQCKAPADWTFLKDAIRLLVSDRSYNEINIKVLAIKEGEDVKWVVRYIDSYYPTQEQYNEGVRGELFYAERHDPSAKSVNKALNDRVGRFLAETGAHEALLVNTGNLVTEGSRSNIIFTKGDTVYTAPDSYVLKGITRKYLLKICSDSGIPVEYKLADARKLGEFDSAAMTGTSPVVLPFSIISGIKFETANPVFRFLRDEYLKLAGLSSAEFI
jgi:branched-chain amino acid aminotransferase